MFALYSEGRRKKHNNEERKKETIKRNMYRMTCWERYRRPITDKPAVEAKDGRERRGGDLTKN